MQKQLSKEDYTKQKGILEAKLETIHTLLADLDRLYCLGAPFQPGDKVRVTNHKGQHRFLFIEKVKPGYGFKGSADFRYDVLKCKNDGTPAAVRVILSGTEEESMVKV